MSSPTGATATTKTVEKHSHRTLWHSVDQPLYDQFVNILMRQGKKARASKHLSEALRVLLLEFPGQGSSPLDLLERSVEAASPVLSLLSTKRGSKTLLSPVPLTLRQRRRQGILWILAQSTGGSKGGSKEPASIGTKIGKELVAVLKGTSQVLEKKRALYKTALANKSHVRMADQTQQRR